MDQQIAEYLGPLLRDAGLYGTGAVNIGRPDNVRVADRAVHRLQPTETWFPTAALVIEIESPDDETWQKPGFYAGLGVGEVVVVNSETRVVTWLALVCGDYTQVARSGVLAAGPEELAATIGWPPVDD